jgi:hypothetical protein
MDARWLWNLASTVASLAVLAAATTAPANTLDGDLSYARPDRGETIHRVPTNGAGHPADAPLALSGWSAGGGGFSFPGNSAVHHPGSGFGQLYAAVSGAQTSVAPSFAAAPLLEAGVPAAPRRIARVTAPPAETPEEEAEDTEDSPTPSSQAGLQVSDLAILPSVQEDPFVDDEPPPAPEPEQALGPGGEQDPIRQPLIAQIEIAAVPEPLGLSLLGAGLLGLGWLRRRPKV